MFDEGITKRVRRYPLPGESAFHTFYPDDFRGGDSGGGAGEAERGCGFREEGGTYAVVPTATDGSGRPVEDFLLCAPMRIDADEYGLTAMGTKLIDIPETCPSCSGRGYFVHTIDPEQKRNPCETCKELGLISVTHVFDIIGREAYPNVADFIEEARRLGISRRLELADKSQYARLSSRSRLFLLHSRAIIENPADYYAGMTPTELAAMIEAGACPQSRPEHSVNLSAVWVSGTGAALTPYQPAAPGCAALWWHDLDAETAEQVLGDCATCGGSGEVPERYVYTESVIDVPKNCPECDAGRVECINARFSRRSMPSFDYGGFTRPEGIKPLHSLGVFGIFPLARLEIVDPSGGDEYGAAVDRASAAKLPVKITEC